MKQLEVRVSNLEQLHRFKEPVLAVRDGDSQIVKVSGSGEVLMIEEFELRYPDGIVLRIVYYGDTE